MKKDYRVVFMYNGKEPAKIVKPAIERLFVSAYNLYCDSVNPLFDKFNSEYTGPDDGFNPDGEYNKYICDKVAPVAQKVYSRLKMSNTSFGRIFSGFTVEGPGVLFKAILKNGTKMYFYLKEL